jgi:hypothetical protein
MSAAANKPVQGTTEPIPSSPAPVDSAPAPPGPAPAPPGPAPAPPARAPWQRMLAPVVFLVCFAGLVAMGIHIRANGSHHPDAPSKTGGQHHDEGKPGTPKNVTLTNGSDDHSTVDALMLAGLCLITGLSCVWASIVWHGWKCCGFDIPHLGHELGMAMIVGSAVVTIIDLTLHVAAHREAANFHAELTKEQSVQAELGELLENVAQELKAHPFAQLSDGDKEKFYEHRLKVVRELKSKLKGPHKQLDDYVSLALDRLGNLAWDRGDFRLAEQRFVKALEIDDAFAVQNSDQYGYRRYRPISYSQIARAQFGQETVEKQASALKMQSNAVSEWEALKGHPLFRALDEPKRLWHEAKDQHHAFELVVACKKSVADGLALTPLDPSKSARADKLDEKGWKGFVTKLETGKTYRITLRADEEAMKEGPDRKPVADGMDPFLIVRGTSQHLTRWNDDMGDADPEHRFDSVVTVQAPQAPEAGDYWVIVTTSPVAFKDRSAKTGAFKLTVQEKTK